MTSALRLLRTFETALEIRVGAAAAELGVSRSTVHRLLATLAAEGFVEHDPVARCYRPGPRLGAIGVSLTQNLDGSVPAATLRALARATGETVHLAVLRGDHVLYLSSVESEQSVRTRSRVGWTLPTHATAAGKALLSALDDQEVMRIYPDEVIPEGTRSKHVRRADLLAELELVRAGGYATNRGESEPDVSAVAAVLRDQEGRAASALVVTAPRSRGGEAWMRRTGEIVTGLARSHEAHGAAEARG